MTNREWAVLGFRLLALWMATAYVSILADLALREFSGREVPWIVLHGTIVLALWTRAGWLAARTFPDGTSSTGTAPPHSEEQPLVLALTIIGVWLVALAVPGLVHGVVALVTMPGLDRGILGGASASDEILQWQARTRAETLGELLRVLIGAVLAFRADRVSATLVTLRQRAMTEDEDPDLQEFDDRDCAG